MTLYASLFDTRAGFDLAALAVTWAAIVVLSLIAVSLHIRLQRLERVDQRRNRATPFAHLVGRPLSSLLDGVATGAEVRLVLFLSPSCPTCERLLAELRQSKRPLPSAVVWTAAAADRPGGLPPSVRLIPDGSKVSAALGIRVTPFALVASEAGTVVQASPLNSLDAVRDALGVAA